VRRVRNKVCVGAAFQFSTTFGDGRRRQGFAGRLRAKLIDRTETRRSKTALSKPHPETPSFCPDPETGLAFQTPSKCSVGRPGD
jgi:hypothetical protein